MTEVVADAELAVEAAAPAQHVAVGAQRAGVALRHRDPDQPGQRRQPARRGRVVVGAVAALALDALAPARELTLAGDRARRVDAGGDRERVELDLHRRVALGLRAVAELARAVVAPAPHRAAALPRAGEETA